MKKLVALTLVLVLLVSCGRTPSEGSIETSQEETTVDSTEVVDQEVVFIEPETPVLSSTKYVSLSLEDAQLIDTSSLYYTYVLGVRKSYPDYLPDIVHFDYPYIYYTRMTATVDGADDDDPNYYIGRYSVETLERVEFALDDWHAQSDVTESTVYVDRDLVFYVYSPLSEEFSIRIEMFDFSDESRKTIAEYPAHNVIGYIKKLNDSEIVFLIYEQVGEDTEQVLVKYNFVDDSLCEIYRGDNVNVKEGTKDIWAFDTEDDNIVLLMQQYLNDTMTFYIRIIDDEGNIVSDEKVDALSEYDSYGDTAESLVVVNDYVFICFSRFTRDADNQKPLFVILKKAGSEYRLVEAEANEEPRYLCSSTQSDCVYFTVRDNSNKLFVVDTATDESYVVTIENENIQNVLADSDGNILVEERTDDISRWYIILSEAVLDNLK